MTIRYTTAAALACVIGSLPAQAQTRTTIVEDGRGQRSTIVTDQQGTRTYDNNNRATYSAGGDRHEEQTQRSMQGGGRVVDDRRN